MKNRDEDDELAKQHPTSQTTAEEVCATPLEASPGRGRRALRDMILERRNRFVAAALTGAGLASSACDAEPQVCLGPNISPGGGGGMGGVGGLGGGPQVCLSGAGSGGAPQPCLSAGGPGVRQPVPDAGMLEFPDAGMLELPDAGEAEPPDAASTQSLDAGDSDPDDPDGGS